MVIVYGSPQGKGRPRFRQFRGYVSTYTPKKTMDYEIEIKNEYYLQDGRFYEKPLHISIRSFIDIPKSWSKKKKEQATSDYIKPEVKPDIDNIAKVVLDALNKVAYADDKQIVSMYVQKKYSTMPRIEIEIKEID